MKFCYCGSANSVAVIDKEKRFNETSRIPVEDMNLFFIVESPDILTTKNYSFQYFIGQTNKLSVPQW